MCVTLPGHLTLHWTESIFSSKGDNNRKTVQEVASARALGLPSLTELDACEPQLQMCHILTHGHLIDISDAS